MSLMGKRVFDIVISFIGLLFFGSIILLSAIAAGINFNGNGFFRQKRIGQFGKPFGIIKVRTMSDSGEISAFGSWMRRSKIDELPQLWNVFIGEMSFVGPRPDVRGYYDGLKGENRKILQLRPGMTSVAAIKYSNEEALLAIQKDPLKYNDEVIFPDKVRLNLAYYYSRSFFGDLKIIWETIFRK